MNFVYDDGGRGGAGYRGSAGDCVVRAIAIAAQLPYQEVYNALHARIKDQKLIRHRRRTPRDGVRRQVFRQYLLGLGWSWIPTMGIGTGCTVHLKAEELPPGRLIVSVSRHLVAVLDGVIHDTHDPSRGGTRCVYGYFVAP